MGLAERQRGQVLGAVAFLQRQDLDFDALQEQVRVLLQLHTRANGLQMQIQSFLDDQARLGAGPAGRGCGDGLVINHVTNPVIRATLTIRTSKLFRALKAPS